MLVRLCIHRSSAPPTGHGILVLSAAPRNVFVAATIDQRGRHHCPCLILVYSLRFCRSHGLKSCVIWSSDTTGSEEKMQSPPHEDREDNGRACEDLLSHLGGWRHISHNPTTTQFPGARENTVVVEEGLKKEGVQTGRIGSKTTKTRK